MTWADFYLICFVLGFAFSFFSFLFGGFHWHLPHGFSHMHVAAHAHAGGGVHVSFLNPASIAAFLAWFGGTGYLLTRFSGVWFVLGLIIALGTGLAGASLVFLFFKKVLVSENESLDPADFEMVGVLGRLSMPIREQGTGELIYSQAGTRRTCGARADTGLAISKGTEVVVTRYERGIAYVRPWSEMAGEEPAAESGALSS